MRMSISALVPGRLKEARRFPRRTLGTRGWIRADGGFSVRACTVADLSQSGVRLVVDDPRHVAEDFRLLFERDAGQGRRCRVTWRKGAQIGAKFVG